MMGASVIETAQLASVSVGLVTKRPIGELLVKRIE